MPALDGLRGLAVVAVLLFHGGWAGARGGFLGVDVFFVLSGFLITSLLLAERGSTGTISLRRFWSRRARRLLPALLLVVAAVAAAAPFFDPSAQVGLRGDALAALAYVANWRFVLQGADYFGRTAADSPLNHLWSLAIEEQFYLAWPLVVLAVARRRRARAWVGAIALTGAAASATAMVLLHRAGAGADRVYYGTDTRAHTVLIGATLAALLDPRADGSSATAALWPRAGRLLLGVAGTGAAAALVAGVALVQGGEPWLYDGGLPLLSLAAAILVGHAVLLPDGVLGSLLKVGPLCRIGRLSYGLYLWHWPLYLLLTAARTGLSGGSLLAGRLGATFALALVTERLLERPIRAGRLRRPRAGLAGPVAAATMTAVVVAATVGAQVPSGHGPTTVLAAETAAPDLARPVAETAAPDLAQPVAETAAPDLAQPATPAVGAPTRTRSAGEPVSTLVLGDSVALTLARGMTSQGPRAGVALTEAALLGCGVARGGPLRYVGQEQAEPPPCATWPTHWSDAVDRQDPDVALVVVGRWEVVDRFWNGRWAHLGEPDFDQYIEAELDQAVAAASSRGARVALASAPYYWRGERRDGGLWPEDDPRRVDRLNELVRSVAGRHPDQVSFIDLGAKTAKDGGYTRSLEGVQLRYDGVHFTPVGARWLAPWLLPQLEALGPAVGGPAARAEAAAGERRPGVG